MKFKDMLLQESLANLSFLDQLNLTRVERWEPGEADAPGPPVWTATYFEGDEAHADEVAAVVSKAMVDSYWFANIHCRQDEIVIFADKVFRYRRGNVTARKAPEDHARSKGVPEHQLDWERDS